MNFLQVFGESVSQGQGYSQSRWVKFVSALDSSGFWATENQVAVFIDLNLSPFTLYQLIKLRNHQKILVRVEPRSVNPVQFTKCVRRYFDLCIDELSVSDGNAELTWPAGFDLESAPAEDSQRRYQVGALIGQKISFYKDSQYHLRVRLLEALQREKVKVCYAGRGWNRGGIHKAKAIARALFLNYFFRLPFLNPRDSITGLRKPRLPYLGEFHFPSEFYKTVKVALVVENESLAVSEKIFEALGSDCSVVYLGKPLPKMPSVLQIDSSTRIEEIVDFINLESSRYPSALERSRETLRANVMSSRDSFELLATIVMTHLTRND
jgi:hypothetical protein